MSWKKVKIESLCTVVRGSSPRPQGDPRYYNGPVPRLMIEDLTRDGKYVTPKVDSLTIEGAKLSRPMNKGDLVITVSGRTGVPAILDVDCCIHDGFAGFRNLSDRVDIDYLFHYLNSLTIVTSQQAVGAIFKNLTTDQLKNIEIPLPPLPIQKQIAAILDAADALRRKDQELLKKYDELAQAIFIDMFGDPVKNEKGWEERKIKDIIRKDKYAIKAGPFGSSLKKEFYTNSGYKIYGQEQVIVDDLSIGNYYIDEDRYSLLKNCAVNEGDVLISLVGTYGKIAVIPKEFEKGIINPRLMKISVDKEIYNPYFLKYLLQTNQMYDKISRLSRGGTMDIVNVGLMSEVLVIVPPLTKQEKFIKVYNDLQTAKSTVKSHKSDALFNSLIQKAFKGKLVKEEALV